MIRKLLIANRGEIACRVMRSAARLGIGTVAVYSDADRDALHVEMADEAVRIGPAPARESYLDIGAILDACRRTGADAVHPGYGFLSENADFAEALEAAGVAFVGPPASAIRAMGLKDAAKRLMERVGVPVTPGYHGEDQDQETLAVEARRIGYPVLIKARAGGGGKGMRRVDLKEEFAEALAAAQREAEAAFGDGRVLIEKFVQAPRHIEVQVFADGHGNAVHLYERDCSLQRRHQKVIEEAPAPGMTPGLRAAMGEAALRAAQAIGYRGAGTVEFLVDASEGLRADRFYFMEMNTRLQVEHPVTEAVTGLDMVEWQLRVASGEALPLAQEDIACLGHAFEARIYAEDPARGFLPQTGRIARLDLPDTLARIDTGMRAGDAISPHYDPMIAKLIVHGETRAAALATLGRALDRSSLSGTTTNLDFLCALVRHEGFAAGAVDTALIDRDLAELLSPVGPPAPLAECRALAAVAALGLPRATGASPWETLTGWRSWGPAAHRVTLEDAGERIALQVLIDGPGRFRVRGADGEVAIHWADAAVERIEVDGVLRRVGVETLADGVAITLGGTTRLMRPVDPFERENEIGPGGDAVFSPMPGLVKRLAARPGQDVVAGETLAVLEAMKMEHALKAPRDGIVASVMVAEGDQVEDGAALLQLEPV